MFPMDDRGSAGAEVGVAGADVITGADEGESAGEEAGEDGEALSLPDGVELSVGARLALSVGAGMLLTTGLLLLGARALVTPPTADDKSPTTDDTPPRADVTPPRRLESGSEGGADDGDGDALDASAEEATEADAELDTLLLSVGAGMLLTTGLLLLGARTLVTPPTADVRSLTTDVTPPRADVTPPRRPERGSGGADDGVGGALDASAGGEVTEADAETDTLLLVAEAKGLSVDVEITVPDELVADKLLAEPGSLAAALAVDESVIEYVVTGSVGVVDAETESAPDEVGVGEGSSDVELAGTMADVVRPKTLSRPSPSPPRVSPRVSPSPPNNHKN